MIYKYVIMEGSSYVNLVKDGTANLCTFHHQAYFSSIRRANRFRKAKSTIIAQRVCSTNILVTLINSKNRIKPKKIQKNTRIS
jgi:hypothetical protein